jgi:hypothetical protein
MCCILGSLVAVGWMEGSQISCNNLAAVAIKVCTIVDNIVQYYPTMLAVSPDVQLGFM